MSSKTKICTNCGFEASKEDMFCFKCGTKFEEDLLETLEEEIEEDFQEPQVQAEKQKKSPVFSKKASLKSNNRKSSFKPIAIVLLILFVGGYGFWYLKSHEDNIKKPIANNATDKNVNYEERTILSQVVSPKDTSQSFGDNNINVTIPPEVLDKEETLSIKEKIYNTPKDKAANISAVYDITIGDKHELNGVVEIDIKYETPATSVGAMYYDVQEKQWIPILCKVDSTNNKVKIFTDHLTNFAVVKFQPSSINPLTTINTMPSIYSRKFNDNTIVQILNAVKSNKNGIDDAVREGFNAANDIFQIGSASEKMTSLTFEDYLDPEVNKKINGLASKMSYSMILMQLAVDMTDKDKTNLEATYNFLKSVAYELPEALASKLMSIGVFSIDYSLDKFARTSIEDRYKLNDKAYHIYYQKLYKEKRNAKQWYYVLTDIIKNSKNDDEIKAKIDSEIDRYINEFWTEKDTMGIAEAYQQAGIKFTGGAGLNQDVRDKISNNYKCELMQYLQGVFNQISKKIVVERSTSAYKDINEFTKELNKVYTVRVEASGDADKIANLPIKLLVDKAGHQKAWQGVTDKNGIFTMKFTLYGYLRAEAKNIVKLTVNSKELEQKFIKLNSGGLTVVKFNINEEETTNSATKNSGTTECYCGLHSDYSKLQYIETNNTLEGNEKAYFVPNTATKEGISKYYFTDNNKLYKYGCYVNNKVHGKWTFYFTNGNKSSEMNFNNGEKIGKFIVYHENGKISIEGNYTKGDKLDGAFSKYNESGQPLLYEEYSNGILNGIQRIYTYKGVMTKQAKYANGKLNGPMTMWDEDGNKIFEGNYVNDEQVN